MNKNQDTLFVDLKYTILYRKLHFTEKEQDIYIKQYDNHQIIIESENKFFTFNNTQYSLHNYRNFVMLELIDRLLRIGYKPINLEVIDETRLIIKKEDIILVNIILREFGNDYSDLLIHFSYSDVSGTTVLYTSQLTGGLIEYKTLILHQGLKYTKGILERNSIPYQFHLANEDNSIMYDDTFVVHDNVLQKYLGNVAKVCVPDGIRQIGPGAFWNNLNINEVILPSSISSIHGDAFVYCENLDSINIPPQVSEIGDDPFAGCPNLVIYNHSPHFLIDDGVLFDASKNTLIHYYPNKIEKEYIVPESVTWIGKHSFYKCINLKQITISKNVDFIGNNAFSDCSNLKLKNGSKYFKYVHNVLYNSSGTHLIHFSMGSKRKKVKLLETTRTIGRNSFWNCTSIKKLIITSDVRQIGYNPFAKCINMKFENHSPFYAIKDNILFDKNFQEVVCVTDQSPINNVVELPESVINIGRNSFTGCCTLERIKLPKDLVSISRGAFSECCNLKSIEIPSSVKDIGDWAFNNCRSLESVILPQHVIIKPNTFNGCSPKISRY